MKEIRQRSVYDWGGVGEWTPIPGVYTLPRLIDLIDKPLHVALILVGDLDTCVGNVVLETMDGRVQYDMGITWAEANEQGIDIRREITLRNPIPF